MKNKWQKPRMTVENFVARMGCMCKCGAAAGGGAGA
jgi:hypothetical protein